MSASKTSLVEALKNKALEILRDSDVPLGIGDIAKRLGVSWSTARAMLLTLEAERKVQSLKTAKSKVFFYQRKRGRVSAGN